MKYYFGSGYIQDGLLKETDGRIVIYGDRIMVSFIRSTDHNYLLRSLAAQYRLNKGKVIDNAIRLYFRAEEDRVIVAGCRKIDDEEFWKNSDFYARLIKSKIK
jgi:hypothetical protein